MRVSGLVVLTWADGLHCQLPLMPRVVVICFRGILGFEVMF